MPFCTQFPVSFTYWLIHYHHQSVDTPECTSSLTTVLEILWTPGEFSLILNISVLFDLATPVRLNTTANIPRATIEAHLMCLFIVQENKIVFF